MIKRILPIAVLSGTILANTGCKHEPEFKKFKGIEYKIVKDVPGNLAKTGDIIEFHCLAKTDSTELFNSRKENGGKPTSIPMMEVTQYARFESVFQFLSAGDSAVVNISCDTILADVKKQQPNQMPQLPPWMKPGKKLSFYVNIVAIKSKEQADKEAKEKAAVQATEDDKTLQDYFAKNNIKATKTASGLYYVITKEGTGNAITPGQMVSVNYTGKLLNGFVFDSNLDSAGHSKKVFEFPVGGHQVIPGMDEGVMLLKKGSKATLYIPSGLAYGERPMGPNFPGNSTLHFDVEILDVKETKQQPQPQQP